MKRKPVARLVGVYSTAQRAKTREVKPVPEGGVRCSTCGNGVRLRADGTMRAHPSRPGIACPGAVPRIGGSGRSTGLCEHGSDFAERGVRCACPKQTRAAQ